MYSSIVFGEEVPFAPRLIVGTFMWRRASKLVGLARAETGCLLLRVFGQAWKLAPTIKHPSLPCQEGKARGNQSTFLKVATLLAKFFNPLS